MAENNAKTWGKVASSRGDGDGGQSFGIKQLLAVVDVIPHSVSYHDRELRYVFANHGFEETFHLKRDEIIGKTPGETLGEAAFRRNKRHYDSALDGNFTLFQDTVQAPDGKTRHLQGHLIPDIGATGEVLGLYSVLTDVTAFKEKELELARSERKFRAMAERSTDMISTHSLDGTFKYVSPACRCLLGLQPEELLGVNLFSMAHPDDAATIKAARESLGKKFYPVGITCRLHHKNGCHVWVEIMCGLLEATEEKEDKECAIVAVTRDISERKRLEELKEDIEKITRHDLKTPLSGIIGLTDSLLRKPEDLSASQLKRLLAIRDSGQHAYDMINLSLCLYMIERGVYPLDKRKFNLLPLLNRVLEELRKLAEAKRLEVKVSVNGASASETSSFHVHGEYLLCYCMVSNLIRNAMEASPPGQQLRVRLFDGLSTEIVIENKGAVPPKIRSRFFEKYITCGKPHGTGLGTYSAWLVAHTHGGQIAMNTPGEERTVVTVTLPN